MNKKNIKGITVIPSAVCNLNCSFCFLNKNESYKEFNQIVQNHWKNKTYLKNVAKSLLKINANLDDIEEVILWGGEPLLTIEQLIPNIPEFYKYFKNLKEWHTSTNFTININNLIKFFIELDKYAKPNTSFRLQLSIDGPEGIFTEYGHNVSWNTYKSQFNLLITGLKNITLNNITIKIFIRPTVDEHFFLEYFSNLENMKNYFLAMDELKEYVLCLIGNNKNIIWGSATRFPSVTVPSTASVEDGIKYAEIERLYQYLKYNDLKHTKDAKIIDMYDAISNSFVEEYCLTHPNAECGEMNNFVTIWPDGTLVECGSCFILPYKTYQDYVKEHNEINEYNTAKASEKVSYNPLKLNQQELIEAEWYSREGFKDNYSTYYMLLLGLADEMALSGQILYKYHLNHELFLKQLSRIMVNFNCTRDNIKSTQIPYITEPATLRKFFNGLTDFAYDNREDNKK